MAILVGIFIYKNFVSGETPSDSDPESPDQSSSSRRVPAPVPGDDDDAAGQGDGEIDQGLDDLFSDLKEDQEGIELQEVKLAPKRKSARKKRRKKRSAKRSSEKKEDQDDGGFDPRRMAETTAQGAHSLQESPLGVSRGMRVLSDDVEMEAETAATGGDADVMSLEDVSGFIDLGGFMDGDDDDDANGGANGASSGQQLRLEQGEEDDAVDEPLDLAALMA